MPGEDLHLAVHARSQAHDSRFRGNDGGLAEGIFRNYLGSKAPSRTLPWHCSPVNISVNGRGGVAAI